MSEKQHGAVLSDLAARGVQSYRRAGPDDRRLACLHILDTVGCCIVGRGNPSAERVRQSLATLGVVGPRRPLGLPDVPLPVDTCASVDAMLAHIDEYDGFHSAAAVAPAAVVVPAAFAVACHERRSGRRFVDAVIAGCEVVVETGLRFAGPALYGASWWPTALFGAVGAAAATAVLLELENDRLVTALSIAAAGTGGLLSDAEFSEGHHLLVGNAAARGVTAAYQSRAGMSAAHTLLDGPASRALGRVAAPPTNGGQVHLRGCSVKPYPCARPLHAVIEALREMSASGVDLKALGDVRISLPAALLTFVSADTVVAGPSEAATSAAFAVAATIDGRETDVTFFRGAVLTGEQMARRVSIGVDEDLDHMYPERWGATVAAEGVGVPPTSVTVFAIEHRNPEALVREKFRRNARCLDLSVMSQWEENLLRLDEVEDMSAMRPETLSPVVL